MSRPSVPEERVERLEEIVDKETDLPASSLTFAEQLEYLLDSYVHQKRRAEHLGDRVDKLEREASDSDPSPPPRSGDGGGPSFG